MFLVHVSSVCANRFSVEYILLMLTRFRKFLDTVTVHFGVNGVMIKALLLFTQKVNRTYS